MNLKKKFKKLLIENSYLAGKFHQKTKIEKFDNINSFKKFRRATGASFKSYPRLDEIILPKPDLPPRVSVKDALLLRQSSRNFSKKPITQDTLSTLLFYSAGLKNKKPPFYGRFYPSAGARYPLEVYLISLNTQVPRGLYHYYLKNHSLEELLTFDKFDFKSYFHPDQEWLLQSSCLIIITAMFKRIYKTYKDRGYRYILFEAGHLAQNFYLISTSLNISCCAMCGFKDDELNRLLDIDGTNESVLYVLAFGNPES